MSVLHCQRSVRRDGHSSRGVLSNVVCLSLIVKSRNRGKPVSLYLTVKYLSVTMAQYHLKFAIPELETS